jgi:heterodisulfide reductase subunit C
MSGSSHHEHDASLAGRVRAATGESVFNCYQCGKCTAGCPLGEEMDYAPNQILRVLQLGLPTLEEEALRAYSIWLCLACETCATRCPQEVSIPKIMDYLREEALRRGVANPKAKDILAFHRSFLDSIRKNGRLHEVGLIRDYKLRTWHFFQDITVAPKLLARGKLKLTPHKIAGRDAIAAMFERCAAESGAASQGLSGPVSNPSHNSGHHDQADKK